MTDDLSAPLGRKKARPPKQAHAPGTARGTGGFDAGRLPLARIAFGVIALIGLGLAARVLLVDDPMGGRPVTDIDINGARGGNAIAESAGALPPGGGVITASPEIPANAPGVTVVGDDVPDGSPAELGAAAADATAPAGLVEDTEYGPIPRISPAGLSPFDAYSRPSLTPATADGRKLIAIVVTGLGINEAGTANAIDTLPDAVTLAFAPYGPRLNASVASARAAGHEILLEVPLEPFDYPESDPGPETLLTGQAPRDNLDKLFKVMARFGGYVGMINHMGARFTASTSDFSPIMEELGSRGLGYLDDGSSNRSVAAQLASANGVQFARADLLLDANPARAPILAKLDELAARADEKGYAVGVMSALPISVQTLAEWAKAAEDQGYVIVPVSSLMQAGQ
jgi:polysaccharide deacetylase 2 family uncharacterized protein YibQ